MKSYCNILFVTFCFSINLLFAQKESSSIEILTQEQFNSSKINNNTYDFWWDNDEYTWFKTGDSLPYFVDITQYKGILNYGVEFSSIDNTNFSFIENIIMYKLKIDIKSFTFNKKDSTVNIQGSVTSNRNWSGVKNNVDIFLGKKKDTLSPIRIAHLINRKRSFATYKSKKIINDTILDYLPSFYVYDYNHYRTTRPDEKNFEIKSKIDKNSILIFGLGSNFSEIFNIGKLVFFNKDTKYYKKDAKYDEKDTEPVVIIRNNIQELSKNKSEIKAVPQYYQITEKAERFILKNQFGNAKQQYDFLLNSNNYIFARDMHNALRCAILARDYETAIVWAEKLVLKGVNLDYFNFKIFDRLKKNSIWKDFIANYPNLNKKYENGLNPILISRLNDLVVTDQIAYSKNAKGEIAHSELKKTTEYIDEVLIKLIKEIGFPTEEKIGISFSEKGIINTMPRYYVLLYHSIQMKSNKLPEIKSILDTTSEDGAYDYLRDNSNVFKKTGSTCLQIYKGNLYNDKTCTKNELSIKKVMFRFKNVHNFILEIGEFIVIPYEHSSASDDALFFKEKFNFIAKLTEDWFWYEK